MMDYAHLVTISDPPASCSCLLHLPGVITAAAVATWVAGYSTSRSSYFVVLEGD